MKPLLIPLSFRRIALSESIAPAKQRRHGISAADTPTIRDMSMETPITMAAQKAMACLAAQLKDIPKEARYKLEFISNLKKVPTLSQQPCYTWFLSNKTEKIPSIQTSRIEKSLLHCLEVKGFTLIDSGIALIMNVSKQYSAFLKYPKGAPRTNIGIGKETTVIQDNILLARSLEGQLFWISTDPENATVSLSDPLPEESLFQSELMPQFIKQLQQGLIKNRSIVVEPVLDFSPEEKVDEGAASAPLRYIGVNSKGNIFQEIAHTTLYAKENPLPPKPIPVIPEIIFTDADEMDALEEAPTAMEFDENPEAIVLGAPDKRPLRIRSLSELSVDSYKSPRSSTDSNITVGTETPQRPSQISFQLLEFPEDGTEEEIKLDPLTFTINTVFDLNGDRITYL
jgi:hypothetical protein